MQNKKILSALVIVMALPVLSGCDGWVTQAYHGVPYNGRGIDDDDRTAGYGVEWVRASMMPSKGPDTKPVLAPPPPAPVPEPVKSAEPLYNKTQQK